MKLKKVLALVVLIAVCMSLCGCDLFTTPTEELVAPPELTGDMYPIAEALSESAKGEYTLRYPSRGERRSAIVLEDINLDGILEAFAFYSTVEDETTVMHINVISRIDNVWESVADVAINAIGVERVDFSDLDGDSVKEIVIGWEIYGSSEKELSVYSYKDKNFAQRLQQKYTGFLCGDLDNNGDNEIFIHLLNTSEGTNQALVFNFDENGTQQTAGCVMDSAVKTASAPILSTLSSGTPAIYIDEIKGIGAITEVLYLSKGELVNPLLDTEGTMENTGTLRAASLSCKDINHDGIVEIPVASDLPSADGSTEGIYYTNWCSFNGESLTVKQITVVNSIDGYYLSVPTRLVGNIAISKDTDNHRRVIYTYDAKEQTVGERIFTITALDADEWDDEDFDRKDMTELYRAGDRVFTVSVSSTQTKYNVTLEEVQKMFNISE